MTSLRLAIKRSLELEGLEGEASTSIRPSISTVLAKPTTSQPPPRQPPSIRIVMKKANRRPRPPPAPVVALPRIDKCIRNSDPSAVDDFGFVEVSSALPRSLTEQIFHEAADRVSRHEKGVRMSGSGGGGSGSSSSSSSPRKRKQQRMRTPSPPPEPEVEEISNALQTDVSDHVLRKVKAAMEDCDVAKRTMATVFGKPSPETGMSNYDGFLLETPKVLITKPGSNPQLPHADDHCSSCVICLIHLRDGQEPTRVARYEGKDKDFPTGITVGCDRCNRKEQLPDSDFRRGVHLTDELWHCDCAATHSPYDFEGKLTRSFGELLDEDAPDLCDAYAGPPDPSAGDGIFGVPTLIHRGPGNSSRASASRFVLFLTLRPAYRNMKARDADKMHHRYNPALQIHASCILYNQFKKVNSIYERGGCGLDGYFGAIVGAETASLMREVKELREENLLLREKVAKRRLRAKERKERKEI